MTVLAPMRPEVYATYLEASVAGYAEDNTASGRWPREGAVERSRANYLDLPPQWLATPDNYLYEIMADDGGPIVGVIWFAVEARHGVRLRYRDQGDLSVPGSCQARVPCARAAGSRTGPVQHRSSCFRPEPCRAGVV